MFPDPRHEYANNKEAEGRERLTPSTPMPNTICPTCDAYRRMPNRDYALQHLIDTCPTCKGTGHVSAKIPGIPVKGEIRSAPPAPDTHHAGDDCDRRYYRARNAPDTPSSTDEPETYPTDTQPGDELDDELEQEIRADIEDLLRHNSWTMKPWNVTSLVNYMVEREQAAYTQGRREALASFKTLLSAGDVLKAQPLRDWADAEFAALQEKPNER